MSISKNQIDKSIQIAKRYGAKKLILFGSALDNMEIDNDIDLACDGIDGWKFYEFGARLEEALLMPVDIVPLTPPSRFTRYIERRGKVIYSVEN